MNRVEYSNGYWAAADDFEFKISIDGRPAVLKNRKQIVQVRGKSMLIPNKAAQAWAKKAKEEIKKQWPFRKALPKDMPVEIQIITYAPDRRRRDLDNAVQGPLDSLVDAGVLSDDGQVKSLDGSRMLYDKKDPRVEITLRPYCGMCAWCGAEHAGGPEKCQK